MEKIPLKNYVETHGQAKAASEIGVTQGAISKALITKRNIYVFHQNGKLIAEEIRRFPSLPKVSS